MKKLDKREIVNLFFSAFLVIGYVICAYFFCTLVNAGGNATVTSLVNVLAFAIFGLLVFYATRIGDGKQIKRFSLATLIVLDLPALLIILATTIPGLPFHTELAATSQVSLMAAAALGYGLPYTFLSGYEQETAESTANDESSTEEENVPSTLGLDDEETDKTESEETSAPADDDASANETEKEDK